MTEKLAYIGQHYLVLAVCALACWGLGQTALPRDARRSVLGGLLGLALGMGIVICGLQAMAIAGQLRPWGILSLLAVGLAAAILQCAKTMPRPLMALAAWWSPLSFFARGSVVLTALFGASTLVLPMVPPAGSDAAMYHLPHARAWAESGALDIHGWLRYPWFPYNLDLPYAPALLLYDDIFAQLLAALPGWVCAGLVFQVALRFTGVPGASVATIFWIQASRDHYAYAGVDLAVSLFVFGAYAAYLQARTSPSKSAWMLISAFFLGVACGGKYQALTFVPLLLPGLWWTDRRPATIAKAALAFLLPCVYWYARNTIMTGDPFQPMGGKIFGFSDWSLADYQIQFADLKRHADWPIWYLWPMLLVPLSREWREGREGCSGAGMRAAFGICAYGIAVWLATSHYSRYLLPVYPLMGILSVVGWGMLFRTGARHLPFLRLPQSPHTSKPLRRAGWILLIILTPLLGYSLVKGFAKVSPTQASRDTYLQGRVVSYEALTYVQTIPSLRVYQVGLDDAIYFSKKPLYGDVFGPWRYADFVERPAPEFAARLLAAGFDTFIIRTETSPATEQQADFGRYFTPLFSRHGVTVYHVRPSSL